MVPIAFALVPAIVGTGMLFGNFARECRLKASNSYPYRTEWIRKQGCSALWSVQLLSFNISMQTDSCGSNIHAWYLRQRVVHHLRIQCK
jgi:hypothetical protein